MQIFRPKDFGRTVAMLANFLTNETTKGARHMRLVQGHGRVLTKAEAAKRAGVTTRCIEHWVYHGLGGRTLTRLQVGGRFFYRPDDLAEFITPTARPAKVKERPIAKTSNDAAKAELRKLGFEC
jgi:hypothetical protein